MTPIVTAHAIDRFMERVPEAGQDRSAAQRAIVAYTARTVSAGASSVFVAGFTFRLDGRTVVTVIRGRHSFIEKQARFCRQRIARECRP